MITTLPTLTYREREVAALVAKGLRNKQIAAELGMAERTVAAHLRAVFLKLNIDSRAELAIRVLGGTP